MSFMFHVDKIKKKKKNIYNWQIGIRIIVENICNNNNKKCFAFFQIGIVELHHPIGWVYPSVELVDSGFI